MIGKILKRHATARLQRQVEQLTAELDAERRRLAVADAEIESLAGVLARDRARIESEAAAYQRSKAESEGITHEPSTDPSVRRFSA